MIDLRKELKALKPNEPDEEIDKDILGIKQAKPGITDEEILNQAKQLVSKEKPIGVTPSAPFVQPKAPSVTAMTPPSSLAAAAPEEEDDLGPEKLGPRDAGMAALQGLAGLGDAITRSYGGVNTDFLKSAMGAENEALARRKTISEEMRKKREEEREERKLGLESMKATLDSMKKSGKDAFEMEEKLRDGFAGQAKTFSTVRDQYGVLQAAAQNPSAAGDLSLIFAYMKLVDPGSTVREGEFANAQNAAGVPDQVRNMWNRALNGQRLSENQRADFVGQAGKLFESHRQTFEATKGKYDSLADAYGLQKDRVTGIIVGESAKPGNEAPVKPGNEAPVSGKQPTVTSQEQYDALPSGSTYIDAKGRQRKKK